MDIIYEMGAAPMMSRACEYTVNTPFAPVFWQTFVVTPTSEDSVPRAQPAERSQTVERAQTVEAAPQLSAANPLPEIGGREGPEPTRFGDWELRGRCIDF
jgi:hypothetical protein